MSPVQLEFPKHLGRFEVGAKIGGGGMATVYVGRAVEADGAETLVALKVIRDELAHDPQFADMFVDEAKILARMSHPNVIRTLEYGVTAPHRYIAMELLSGRTLADVFERLTEEKSGLDLPLAAWICARVAEGVHTAHELRGDDGKPLNVIHRDVNPTNIFLTYAGQVKLIDFGLAKMRIRVSKSADGIVKGKIPYLAPEQARGKTIDRRIDIYALGTTLWETATMKRLFKRDTDVDTLKAIRDAHVPDPRETIDGFPDDLWRIIERALRVDPDERYATAAEMCRDLDAFVEERSTEAPSKHLADLVSRLFPGQEARQERWLRAATADSVTHSSMPPPAPVPIASSSLLDEASIPDVRARVADAPAPLATRSLSRPPKKKPSSKKMKAAPGATGKASSKPKSSTRSTPSRPSTPPASSAPRKSKRRAPMLDQDDDSQRLWISVGIVVAVLVLLAVIFSSR